MSTRLPIEDALPDLIAALKNNGRAVLQAPPGAGKTTRVPLAMLDAGLTDGRIVVLEPRRLATRAAAERMAQTLGQPVGETVGYRIRGDSRVGPSTRIEVVTEGILTRMIQSDPELSGVGAVVFDEFHERSLNADLGLALCLEIAGVLRDDLILLAMSATLDAGPVGRLMEAPLITSEGKSFDVTPEWLDQPVPKGIRYEEAVAGLVETAVRNSKGGVLVFLPGEGEIRRVETLLQNWLPGDCAVRPLFGAMDFAAQRAAIAPVKSGRKIVLATSIAETSLTIEDIRVVVDGGRARRMRFDPGSGMARLHTERVTKAEATQRAGRAGRVAPGVAYKLWTRGEEGALAAFPPAEIESADLANLALELASWGAPPTELPFLTQPPEGAYNEAVSLLQMLGALDQKGHITEHGTALARLPLHPRLGHMLLLSGRDAAVLASLLADRDPIRTRAVDLTLRVQALKGARNVSGTVNRGALERIRADAKRLSRLVQPSDEKLTNAEAAALAYPDRIAQRRKGDSARFVMTGGKGAVLEDSDPLAGAKYLVITDTDGNPREARIRQAIQIDESSVRGLFESRISWKDKCSWSRRDRKVIARQQECLGSVILDDRIWKEAPADAVALAMLDGVKDLGLVYSAKAKRFRARVLIGRQGGLDLPDMSDEALVSSLDEWLLQHLTGVKSAADWKEFDLLEPLRAMLDWGQMQALDKAVPASFTTPLGRAIPIDYSGEHPEISLRIQEMFGQKSHPMVGRTPLRVTLLSPAQRPVQTTLDLPGFWAGSYSDVRKDMRAQYPKHPWPEDPTQADPTLRANRRKRN